MRSKPCQEGVELSDDLLKGRIADSLEGGEWSGGNSASDKSIQEEYRGKWKSTLVVLGG